MNTNKFKALFMGILIIATTFLVTSNNAMDPLSLHNNNQVAHPQ